MSKFEFEKVVYLEYGGDCIWSEADFKKELKENNGTFENGQKIGVYKLVAVKTVMSNPSLA